MTQEKLSSALKENEQEFIQKTKTLESNEVVAIVNDTKGREDESNGMYPGYFFFDDWDHWYPDPS
jgi:hypothetical protein